MRSFYQSTPLVFAILGSALLLRVLARFFLASSSYCLVFFLACPSAIWEIVNATMPYCAVYRNTLYNSPFLFFSVSQFFSALVFVFNSVGARLDWSKYAIADPAVNYKLRFHIWVVSKTLAIIVLNLHNSRATGQLQCTVDVDSHVRESQTMP